MRGYTEITTQQELDAFEDAVDGFVDAIVKEARLLNRGYVEQEGQGLITGDGFDVQLVFQSRSRDHDIEVILCRVQACDLDADAFEDGMPCSITETGRWPEREVRVGDFRGAQMFYRTLPRSGRAAVLGPEMPSATAIPATTPQAGWRQCPACCDAWEEAGDVQFSRCPSCGALTELVADPD
jgi:hypothetical protein